jgi:small subunit ribosomal protein S13
MARIAGIDLPKNKRGVIGLTYIYGIGRSTSKRFWNNGVDENIKVQDWNDDQLGAIRNAVNEFKTEGHFVQKFN